MSQQSLGQSMVPMGHAGMMQPHVSHMSHMTQSIPSLNGMSSSSYQPQQNNCVLLVSNLDPDQIKCYHLFILFGVYGNVVRVKILFNKKDNALLQMSDQQQAQTGYIKYIMNH